MINLSKNDKIFVFQKGNNNLTCLDWPYNLLDFFNVMVNLHTITMNISGISEIKEKYLNSANLKTFTQHSLKKINNNAYYFLQDLETIQISGSFNHIPKNAFVIKDNSIKLMIEIYDTQINGSSFEQGVFSNLEKDVNLRFKNNVHFKYLEESIFRDLLDNYQYTTINLQGNPLNCSDCKNAWILVCKYKNHLIHTYCEDRKDTTKPSFKDFDNCDYSCDQKYNYFYIFLLALIPIAICAMIIIKYKYFNMRFEKKMLKILNEKHLLKDRSQLKIAGLIGSGNYGIVYKALYTEPDNGITIPVGVKTVKYG